ncbi:MAG: ribosomal RNA small subunit methyltransferase A [Candidatus Moranbacteria bacterium CG10_big_fil_rev_8_21_14_0_10_35_21]|nr:MAG: ribosomal RNA small subunit methyltransferase A [Candidatus Moranbacteria bacterium CG10_big_fil_rev_8_21_14_0_10_35_21]PJA88355.1 MAG: ribosomal RNA small subunit methyltransferase A [Candidatus Moranbacteria bacterium CG_4_9_14_3_um_filter_36_9]
MKHIPKKNLGQNFLKTNSIVKRIIESANLSADDFVIEVGPGEGVLTEELAKKAGKVLAIEIDHTLIKPLQKKFENKKNVEIINADILKINLPELLGHEMSKYKVIANLPYYITSPIIRLFLETETPPQEMILMVQKEVAERIVASPSEIPAESRSAKRISRGKPGQMSILAVSVQYYAKPEILFEVGKENFDPIPEVDSAVIKITNSECGIPNAETKKFFRVVKAGFSAKRKTLINNLSSSLHLEKKAVEEKIKAVGLKPTARAQELSVDDWEKITVLLI